MQQAYPWIMEIQGKILQFGRNSKFIEVRELAKFIANENQRSNYLILLQTYCSRFIKISLAIPQSPFRDRPTHGNSEGSNLVFVV